MEEFQIFSLTEMPEEREKWAAWFHEKWNIPRSAYLESMELALRQTSPVPQWYAVKRNERIIGGLGVIENDFHDRKDLRPNVCAVYVEPEYRKKGVAGKMLRFVCRDMAENGIDTLYLVTDHIGFYEKYGWKFYCMAQGDGEPDQTRLYVHRQEKME